MTLALAITGVVLSVLSIAWQAWAWARSGPVVKVTSQNSFTMMSDRGADEWFVSVTATNTGRAACTIEGWGIGLPNNGALVQPRQLPWDPQLPHRLEPHSSADFHMLTDEVRGQHFARRIPYADMRPFVRVSGKGRVFAKRGVPLAD